MRVKIKFWEKKKSCLEPTILFLFKKRKQCTIVRHFFFLAEFQISENSKLRLLRYPHPKRFKSKSCKIAFGLKTLEQHMTSKTVETCFLFGVH